MNPSELIDQRYRLVRMLGTGGMAEVWLAEDLRLGRPVAVKFLLESVQSAESGSLASAIADEARIVARLQHANIVALYDAGVADGRSYLVMEYVDGRSLREVLDSSSSLPESDALRYGQQVAAALHYAHTQGVVHCDVKPENILLSASGDVKVTDFGVAAKVTRTLTPQQAREILGTIAYLAPEVMQGEQATPASDVYSLALTIFELVAGRLPFTGATPALVAAQRLAAPPPPLRSVAPFASQSLEATLAHALAIQPGDRFTDADRFRQALAAAAQRPASSSNPTMPVQVPPPLLRPARHHSTAIRASNQPPTHGSNVALAVAAVGVLLLAIGVGALAFALVTGGDDGTPTPTPTPTSGPIETPTPSPTNEPAPSATPTPTSEPSLTPTPSVTPTRTPTATPTASLSPSPTVTSSPTEQTGESPTATP